LGLAVVAPVVASDDEATTVDDPPSSAEPAAQPAPLPARSRQNNVPRYLKEVITPTLELLLKGSAEVISYFSTFKREGQCNNLTDIPLDTP
jgi:hypothetical protein